MAVTFVVLEPHSLSTFKDKFVPLWSHRALLEYWKRQDRKTYPFFFFWSHLPHLPLENSVKSDGNPKYGNHQSMYLLYWCVRYVIMDLTVMHTLCLLLKLQQII